MKAETQRVALVPHGPLGGLALSVVRALPPTMGRKAARLFWQMGMLRHVADNDRPE
ncbi:hypothetical protein [Magnetospira sp. QH-2]|uniref:hypothetical protein n=1 Tax=Magnetospira sp. (strain QH-2) TaxID=1288970 RepID=UPI00130EC5EC|nr:hypothetical protein [Magnetospira sp. QH-2]